MKAQKAQMPVYGWIFVIIVGAVILLLALIFSGRLLGIERAKSSAEMLRKFDILLDPFSAIGGIAEISLAKEIKMPAKVEIRIECSNIAEEPELGMHTLIFGAELLKKKEFQRYKIYDKYIFSKEISGKNFYVLAKPLELPFRVDDLIYVFNQSYCFVSPPQEIEEELEMINLSAIKAKSDKCEKAMNVCFSADGSTDCNINVDCDDNVDECNHGSVNTKPFVTHTLLYAAVFSSDESYECNLERLIKRLELVAEIYKKKADALATRCWQSSEINNKIDNVVSEFKTKNMALAYQKSEELADKNSMLQCQVF